MRTISLEYFLCIPQENSDWCILACLENILKYYGETKYSQSSLYNLFPPHELYDPYFKAYQELFHKKIENFFAINEIFKGDIKELNFYLKKKIDSNRLTIISIKGQHAIIILGYDENEQKFLSFDPNPLVKCFYIGYRKFRFLFKEDSFDTLVIIPKAL